MGLENKLNDVCAKIAFALGLVVTSQSVADGLSGDVRYLDGIRSGLYYLKIETSCGIYDRNPPCSTFLDAKNKRNIFSETNTENTQELEWGPRYIGRLPFSEPLISFEGVIKRVGKKNGVRYGKLDLRASIGGKDSPVFLGYDRATVSGRAMKPISEHGFWLGLDIKF